MNPKVNVFRRKLMTFLTSSIGSPIKINKRFSLQKSSAKRILVVRPNSRLGNQLMLTPLLQEIEALLPDSKIDLFVRGNLAPTLFRNYRNVDRLIKLPPKPFKQLGLYLKTWVKLRKYRYDIVFNVDAGSSSGRLCTKWVRGDAKFFGASQGDPESPDAIHMAKWPVYNFRKLLVQVGIPEGSVVPKPLSLHLSEEEISHGKDYLQKLVGNSKPTILFYTYATGDKCLSKNWWKPFFAELKELYANDYNLLEVLPKENVSQIDFESLNYYSTDIREMGAVIHHGTAFITGDCGVMHLASSVGIPTIALFSNDNIRTYEPYNAGSVAFKSDQVTFDNIISQLQHIIVAGTK